MRAWEWLYEAALWGSTAVAVSRVSHISYQVWHYTTQSLSMYPIHTVLLYFLFDSLMATVSWFQGAIWMKNLRKKHKPTMMACNVRAKSNQESNTIPNTITKSIIKPRSNLQPRSVNTTTRWVWQICRVTQYDKSHEHVSMYQCTTVIILYVINVMMWNQFDNKGDYSTSINLVWYSKNCILQKGVCWMGTRMETGTSEMTVPQFLHMWVCSYAPT